MSKKLFTRYFFYLVRWQMSTFILAPVVALMGTASPWTSATVANLIGGLIFFWVDKIIFRPSSPFSVWEVKEDVACCDCGKVARGYRLVRAKGYDRTAAKPLYRCEACSHSKATALKSVGVEV